MRHRAALLFTFFILLLSFSISQSQDTRDNAEFKLAVGLYNDGFHAQAADQFKSFIDKFANTSLGIEARFYLGLCQLKLKRYAEARGTFQDFALRYPDNPKAADAIWNMGEIHAIEHNYPEAASAYARLKTFYPKDKRAAEALLRASNFYLKADDIENAKLVLNAIQSEYPQSDVALDAVFASGKLLVASGEYERALKQFTQVQNSNITSTLKARAITAIGEVQALLGNREEAEARFREVMSNKTKSDPVYEAQVRLADLQRQQKKYMEASQNYDAVMRNTEASLSIRQDAFLGAAEAAMGQGKMSEANAVFDSFFSTFASESIGPDVYRRAATVASSAGDYRTASSYLRRLYGDSVISIDRRALMIDIARAEYRALKYPSALQWYQSYIQHYPTDEGVPFAMYEIGQIHEKEFQNSSRAVELYGAIVELYPASAVADKAQFGRGRALETAGKYEAAAEAYHQVMTQYPASSLYRQAEIRYAYILRFQRGSATDALPTIAALLAGLNETPSSARIDFLLAQLYFNDLKDFPSAQRYFTSALGKGLSGTEEEQARYGTAVSSTREVEKGGGSRTEAEQLLIAFVQKYPSGALHDEAAYELFLLRSADQSPLSILDAAATFLATNAKAHERECRLAYADALRNLGKNTEAETEYTALLKEAAPHFTSEALYGRGLVRAAQSNFNAAIEDLRRVEQEAPTAKSAASSLFALGGLLSRIGLYKEAWSAYGTLVERFAYSPLADSARIAALTALLDAGMTDKAVLDAASDWKRARTNPFLTDDLRSEYLYNQAVVLARAKDQTGAKRSLQEYAATYPAGTHIADVYYALGQIFKDEGKISLATSYFQQSSGLTKGTKARQDAAEMLMNEGRYPEAIREYTALAAAVTTQFEKTYALSRIVVAYYRNDQPEEARNRGDEFLKQYPDAESLHLEFNLEEGKLLFRQKQYKKALNEFEDISDEKIPVLAGMGLYWMGKVYEAQGEDEKAQKLWRATVKDYGGTEAALEASLALGRIAQRSEQYDVAAQNFKIVVDAQNVPQKTLKEALNGLIDCYESMKFFDAATEMTKRFIAAYPNDASAFTKRINLGDYLYQLGYFDQAITHFETLLPQASTDDQAVIRYSIGQCYYYKGDFTQAALEFLKVPYLVVRKTEIDWTASSYHMAGQCYEKLGKSDLAIGMYQKIVDTPGIDARFKAQAQKDIDRVKMMIKP